MSDQKSPWYELVINPATEDSLNLLIEIGTAGAELVKDTLRCWVDANEINLETFKQELTTLGLNCETVTPVPIKEWAANCEDLFDELEIESWNILPVRNPSKPPEGKDNDLLIIPGSGFGTGHHPTTKMMLELMQKFSKECAQYESLLDIGTGSGILAIAAAKFWGKSVLGVDIDEHAIRNATWNRRLNSVQSKVSLVQGTAYSVENQYELVFANLLSEILIDLKDWIKLHTKSESMLFLSGILETEIDMILESFQDQWKLEKKLVLDDWSALAFKKAT